MEKEKHFGGNEFVKHHQNMMETGGFWDEVYKSVLFKSLELSFKREILRDMHISDIVLRDGDNKVLIKWKKRFRPLTDEELEAQYGN